MTKFFILIEFKGLSNDKYLFIWWYKDRS